MLFSLCSWWTAEFACTSFTRAIIAASPHRNFIEFHREREGGRWDREVREGGEDGKRERMRDWWRSEQTKEGRSRRGVADRKRRQRTFCMRGKVIWLEATSADSRKLAHLDNLIFPSTPALLLDANVRGTRSGMWTALPGHFVASETGEGKRREKKKERIERVYLCARGRGSARTVLYVRERDAYRRLVEREETERPRSSLC